MSSTKYRVTWSTFYIVLGCVFFTGAIYIFNTLLTSIFGVNPDQSFIFLSVWGIICLSAIAYGCYGAIRIKCFGETLDSRLEKMARMVPQNPKVLFWLMAPLLFPAFIYMYSILLTIAIWAVTFPFGNAAEKHSVFSHVASLR
jgi:hypothetical protein